MALTLDTATKTARLTATRDQVANGTIEILDDDGTTVLATFGLDATAGTVTDSTWTIGLDATTVAASATGQATTARFKNSSGTVKFTGLTIGGTTQGTQAGKDIVLNTTEIGIGANVTLSSLTWTHP